MLFVRLLICASLVLSVSSSFWCLGRAAACDCGTSWTVLFPFLPLLQTKFNAKDNEILSTLASKLKFCSFARISESLQSSTESFDRYLVLMAADLLVSYCLSC